MGEDFARRGGLLPIFSSEGFSYYMDWIVGGKVEGFLIEDGGSTSTDLIVEGISSWIVAGISSSLTRGAGSCWGGSSSSLIVSAIEHSPSEIATLESNFTSFLFRLSGPFLLIGDDCGNEGILWTFLTFAYLL
jgi:hypothetical protein